MLVVFFAGNLLQAAPPTSAAALNATAKDGSFFDPHNHTSGVLNPLAVVNAQKFIKGEQPSEAELSDFWFKFLKYYNDTTCDDDAFLKAKTTCSLDPTCDEDSFTREKCVKVNKLKSSNQLSNGTKLVLNCDEPALYCSSSEEMGEQCMNSLLRNITNILAATPLTSFSGAYAVRRALMNIPDLPGLLGIHVQQQATVLELALAGISLVEMSLPFDARAVDGEKKLASSVLYYRDLLKDLSAAKTSAKNQELKERFTKLGLNVPQIKWLLLTPASNLGKISETQTLSYISGQCQALAVSPVKAPSIDAGTGLYNAFLKFEDVVGMDVAGPEYTCFAKEGMAEFKKLAAATYRASKDRAKKYPNHKKLVVRAHVGEGAPIEDGESIKTLSDEVRAESCEAMKVFPKIKQINNREGMMYVHQYEARKNIGYILNAISDLKKQHRDLDDFVVFRLGHLTHISKSQAEFAKTLGISADVNLSSNIATQAWTVDQSIIDKYLVKKGINAINVRSLLVALKDNGATYPEIFDGHGLKWLLLNRVPTTLGSDGAGVEHSPSMKREYLIAEELINAWNNSDPEFRKAGITIDYLLNNQKIHLEQMGYK